MITAFTLCSNNYLAHAKTLGDSFLEHHPEAKFIIGLVDRVAAEFDYAVLNSFEIIPVEQIGISGFNELANKYNIAELNTSVKPSYIQYIFENYPVEKLLYIDPDILVTGYFKEVFDLLDTYDIVLTPHICSPVDDEFLPTDYHTLRGGIFNLGFIGLHNYNAIKPFLNWWHNRVVKYGYSDFTRNMFYDQLWINYVPVMFDNYYILKHPGYNVAVWNLHERKLEDKNGSYVVNEHFPLKFYHFSSYKYNCPESISTSSAPRYNFETRPDLKRLFKTYHGKLIENNVETISKIGVFFRDIKLKDQTIKKHGILKKIAIRLSLTTKFFFKGGLH